MGHVAIGWIVFLSIWTFFMMGYDKRQAKLHKQRISEKTLWVLAIAGGGIGAYLGMQIFRHKTRHTSFRVGFLILALLDLTLALWLAGLRVPVMNELF